MIEVRKAAVGDVPAIHRLAESLRLRPPDVDKGFLVHVRTEEVYRHIIGASKQSLVAIDTGEEKGGRAANAEGGKGLLVGFLLAYSFQELSELSELTEGPLKGDVVVEYIKRLGEKGIIYADQIGVELDYRRKGVGQALAGELMGSSRGAHFLAAIMHRPYRNDRSLRLATRNGWKLRTEVPEGDLVWGIYEFK